MWKSGSRLDHAGSDNSDCRQIFLAQCNAPLGTTIGRQKDLCGSGRQRLVLSRPLSTAQTEIRPSAGVGGQFECVLMIHISCMLARVPIVTMMLSGAM